MQDTTRDKKSKSKKLITFITSQKIKGKKFSGEKILAVDWKHAEMVAYLKGLKVEGELIDEIY